MRGPFRLPVPIAAGLSLLFLAAPSAACPVPSPTFPPILDRWNPDCDAFGKALAPARRHLESGGIVQDFENGQIAVHPRWAGYPGAPMPGFVLSARVDGNRIHVAWADTDPFEYDFFHVRWDVDDHDEHLKKQHEPQGGITILGVNVGGEDPQQIEEKGNGNSGRAAFDATRDDVPLRPGPPDRLAGAHHRRGERARQLRDVADVSALWGLPPSDSRT